MMLADPRLYDPVCISFYTDTSDHTGRSELRTPVPPKVAGSFANERFFLSGLSKMRITRLLGQHIFVWILNGQNDFVFAFFCAGPHVKAPGTVKVVRGSDLPPIDEDIGYRIDSIAHKVKMRALCFFPCKSKTAGKGMVMMTFLGRPFLIGTKERIFHSVGHESQIVRTGKIARHFFSLVYAHVPWPGQVNDLFHAAMIPFLSKRIFWSFLTLL